MNKTLARELIETGQINARKILEDFFDHMKLYKDNKTSEIPFEFLDTDLITDEIPIESLDKDLLTNEMAIAFVDKILEKNNSNAVIIFALILRCLPRTEDNLYTCEITDHENNVKKTFWFS